MQWNLGAIIDYISDIISPGVPLSDAHTAFVKNLINSSASGIAITFPINELKLPDQYIRAVADYAIGTVTATDGSTTVTGSGTTAWDYKMIGRKISIDGERTYYTVVDVTGAHTLILDRAYNGTGGAGLAYNIFENSFDLPEDIGATGWIKGVFDPDQNYSDIEEVSWDWIDTQDPSLQSTGQVEKYALIGNKNIREPFGTTNYTAAAATTTTSVAVASLKSDDDDYYNGWTLVNVTQGKTCKIIDSVCTPTGVLTLEEAIAGQTSGDEFYLLKSAPQITFYRRPATVKDYLVKGYKATPKLLNLYDVPVLSEDFLDLIAYQVLAQYYAKDAAGLGRMWEAAASEKLDSLKSKYSRKTDSRQREGAYRKSGRTFSFGQINP